MIICRFRIPELDTFHYGLWQGEDLHLLQPSEASGGSAEAWAQTATGEVRNLSEVQLCVPCTPSKIVCVGRNYRAHAAELGNVMPTEPLLFLKPPSSLLDPGQTIRLPPASSQVEHEGELGVVIGRTASRLAPADDPLSYVLGYTCVNDVTARDIQRHDVQFTRGKSFDTFCPVGPYLVSGLDPTALTVTTKVNGQLRQEGRTADMAFPVAALIHYISHAMTLFPGDLIATGTPAGVGPLRDGDTVTVEISGLGVLSNQVALL